MSSLQQCGCSRAVRLQAELLPLVARERLEAAPRQPQLAPPFGRQPTVFAPVGPALAPPFSLPRLAPWHNLPLPAGMLSEQLSLALWLAVPLPAKRTPARQPLVNWPPQRRQTPASPAVVIVPTKQSAKRSKTTRESAG